MISIMAGRTRNWRPAVLSVLTLTVVCCQPSADETASSEPLDASFPTSERAIPGRLIDPPVGPTAMAANLALASGQVVLSWIETTDSEADVSDHRLLFSRFDGDSWSQPVSIAQGNDFFANWADIPAVVEAESGTLFAHWLAKTAADTYAYSIFLARSIDGGESWQLMGRLNDDDTATEHGFVSFTKEGKGVRAFWLDGREMQTGEPMTLRTALITESIGAAEVLDRRVCECCSTDSALTDEGPIVAFRDRDEAEVRDVGIVRRVGNSWSEPEQLRVDGWEIPGCPVNGPEIAAKGASVAVAWFTAADDRPRVQVAFSRDSGAHFEGFSVLDDSNPLGRVDVVMDNHGRAIVSWLAVDQQTGRVSLRVVDPAGARSDPVQIGGTSAGRASGVPRLVATDNYVYVAYLELSKEGDARLRVREIGMGELPEPMRG